MLSSAKIFIFVYILFLEVFQGIAIIQKFFLLLESRHIVGLCRANDPI